jgi:predicted choloylglycine hydrolase
MYQVRLKGTYYEMGIQQGQLMKGRSLPPIWSESIREVVPAERAKFAHECEEIVRRYMPDFLDELQGISDATRVDYQKVKIWPLCSYARLQQSCTAIAISGKYTAQGNPLFIRNYDYLDSDQKDFTVFWTKPQNGYASVGFSDSMSSRYCGFNEKGLAIATSISGYSGPTQPGLVFSLVARWILDQYPTARKAVEFLKRVPHFHGWNFLLCDMEDNIIRVETCPERVETIDFDGFGVSTNHYLSEHMQKFEDKDWRSEGSTEKRHVNSLTWFRSLTEPITADDACQLAQTRVDKGGICDRFVGIDGGTLWSWIHAIGEPTVLISDGAPCENSYQKIHAL